MTRLASIAAVLLGMTAPVSCGSDSESKLDSTAGDSVVSDSPTDLDDARGDSTTDAPALDLTPDGEDQDSATDARPQPDVPEKPQPPKPKAYTEGTCPVLVAGKNGFKSKDRRREIELWLPSDPSNAALVYVWHGLGDSPKNIVGAFNPTALTEENHAIIVAPYDCCASGIEECCATPFVWGFSEGSSKSDLFLFDDLLSCIDQQFDIDNTRVYTTSFSAGSLFSTYLVINRGQYLAAAGIFSGGTGNIVEYATPKSKVPVLLAYGGDSDVFAGGLVNFKDLTLQFQSQLSVDGHFVVLCNHNLGHTVPYGANVWDRKFLFSLVWGEANPFESTGLTTEFPEYCSFAQ